MPNRTYRVYIAIYDDIETTKANPLVSTDEPMFSGEAAEPEMAIQAYRTYRNFLQASFEQ